MKLEAITKAVQREALDIFGYCHTRNEDGLGEGTILLLGPMEPGFWSHVRTVPEFSDADANPLDRWSERILTEIANKLGARALFPFGVPARPFIGWAIRSGRAWISPVGMLVHDQAGLLVSFRGALFVDELLPESVLEARPCDRCEDQPCLSACPVSALSSEGYELEPCHEFLNTADGKACMSYGCQVRRSCPVSQSYPRDPAQSEFHMAAFHRRN